MGDLAPPKEGAIVSKPTLGQYHQNSQTYVIVSWVRTVAPEAAALCVPIYGIAESDEESSIPLRHTDFHLWDRQVKTQIPEPIYLIADKVHYIDFGKQPHQLHQNDVKGWISGAKLRALQTRIAQLMN